MYINNFIHARKWIEERTVFMVKQRFTRIHLIVLDSVGIGEAPDAALFQDEGAHTLGHIAEQVNGLHMPNMEKLGFGNIEEIKGIKRTASPLAHYGKMQEKSSGKDTMTGHWELMGLCIDVPFQTFPSGFPDELIEELTERTGRKVIGNKVASGTVIIEELGEIHQQTGAIIVYTSADSVLQIAAHEETISLEELYDICQIARELTLDERYRVGRVIARPFIGEKGAYTRTPNRHDYALKPFGRTVMNELKDNGYDCIAIGKINDIYDGEGVTKAIRTTSNEDGMDRLEEVLQQDFCGLSFLNLVDFDAQYGHRRDPIGYAQALEVFDERLKKACSLLKDEDLLIITADHGNDPTYRGTDHTREYVPLICYHRTMKQGKNLGIRATFSDVGATIAENFNVRMPKNGTSFLRAII